MFGKLFKFLTKLVLLAGLVAIAIPAIFLAWRMGQPMDLPEFKGLTYYEYLDWRGQAYADLAEQYQARDLNRDVKEGMCERVDMVVETYGAIPSIGLRVVLFELDWATFLPTWWATYETELLKMVKHKSHTSVDYCRIPGVIPDDFVVSIR